MGVNSLPKTVTRQRRGCALSPGPSAPQSSTLATRLPSHPTCILRTEIVTYRCYVNWQISVLAWTYCQQISNCTPVLTYWPTDWGHQWLTDCWSCTAFCCGIFSFLRQLCTAGHGTLNSFLLINYIMLISTDVYFKTVWVTKSCTTVYFTYSLSTAIFWT